MYVRAGCLLLVMVGLLQGTGGLRAEEAPPAETVLDRYLHNGDTTFAFKLVSTLEEEGCTAYVLELTSQTWRTTADVDRPVWTHWLTIVKPHEVMSSTAFLMIAGGSHQSPAPTKVDDMIKLMAVHSKSVVASLSGVPNQPLIFNNDGKKRTEDDLIAYTWDQFMKTKDDHWPARLPMVKSAVKAMDAIQAFMASDQGGGVAIDSFVVGGGSKRGWTTWLTGASDPRVRAIVPIVIDVLNVRVSMQHHHDAYGFWAPAVGDYVRHKIVNRSNDPAYIELLKIEDPYEYRHRLSMPKYIVNAAGDEFFLPDSSQFYFDQLPGEKYLRYVPNAGHSLAGTDARQSILAWYQTILCGVPRPKFTWTMEEDGSIRVQTQDRPQEVHLWQAHNPKARDFRLQTIKDAYTSTPITDSGDGVYVGRIEPKTEGFTAFFVELTYPGLGEFPLKFTTAVRVLPDTLPHKGKPLAGS
jgi:PhoPQ-activated pathogenicity-related protein